MQVRDMLYNFRLKCDNIDSKNAINLPVPAIIYLLNEGQQSLLKKRYSGNNTTLRASFEEIQKRRDEFQRILVTNEKLEVAKQDDNIFTADVSKTKHEYLFLARTNTNGTKGTCKRKIKGILIQTDDLDIMEDSPLEKSSFEWGEVLFRMTEDKLQFITDGTFVIDNTIIDYLRYPKEISITGFKTFSGTASTDQDCELPRFMHYDIVDEAILVYTLSLSNPDAQAKLMKLQNNE